MSLRVLVSHRAERDVDIIFDWLAARSKDGAVRWYQAYLASLRSLPMVADRSGIAPEAEQLRIELHQVFFKTRKGRRYRSLFVIHEDLIHLVAVRGPGQDVATMDEMELPE